MTSNLTPTSYAILGLLAVRPHTTYELATQIDRTVRRFWPRARSKPYEEPEKLVVAGMAEATKGAHGRRPHTVYSITPAGREALVAWLATDSAEPSLESEHILKIFYGDSGTTENLRHRDQGDQGDQAEDKHHGGGHVAAAAEQHRAVVGQQLDREAGQEPAPHRG